MSGLFNVFERFTFKHKGRWRSLVVWKKELHSFIYLLPAPAGWPPLRVKGPSSFLLTNTKVSSIDLQLKLLVPFRREGLGNHLGQLDLVQFWLFEIKINVVGCRAAIRTSFPFFQLFDCVRVAVWSLQTDTHIRVAEPWKRQNYET